jgi:hypothetical protein
MLQKKPGEKDRGLDVWGDAAVADQTDFINRAVGLYSGDAERVLRRARDDLAAATLKATGPWPESKLGQTDVVVRGSSALVGRWRDYWYDLVSPQEALAELGVDPPEGEGAKAKALEILNLLLPPPTGVVVTFLEAPPVVPEDPRVGALKSGLPVGRVDFDLAYSFMVARARGPMAVLHDRAGGRKK